MSERIETTAIRNLIHNEEYCRKVLPFIKEEYFTDRLEKLIFTEIYQFVNKYNNLPTKESLSIEMNTNKGVSEGEYKKMNEIAGKKVTYVGRGGLFGGHKDAIREANGTYYGLLNSTLESGYMGTEESIFAIMAHKEPHMYRTFMLDDNGLIVKFTEALVKDNVKLESIPKEFKTLPKPLDKDQLNSTKTNLYILCVAGSGTGKTQALDGIKKFYEYVKEDKNSITIA